MVAREFDPTKVLDFIELQRHYQVVHGTGRDAVRGPAAAGARSGFFAAEVHVLRRFPDPGGAAQGVHRGVRLRLRPGLWHDRDYRQHRGAAAGGSRRGVGANALGRQGAARRRTGDPRCRRQTHAAGRSRRDCHAFRLQHGRILEPAGSDRPDHRPRRLAAHRRRRYLDRDGYLYIHDRIKDMIISGGENIYPAEVESAICDHPAIAEVAVIGVPDDQWGEAVKAIVVLKQGREATAADIIGFVRQRIAGYKTPKSVEFVGALPRNASGKSCAAICAIPIG